MWIYCWYRVTRKHPYNNTYKSITNKSSPTSIRVLLQKAYNNGPTEDIKKHPYNNTYKSIIQSTNNLSATSIISLLKNVFNDITSPSIRALLQKAYNDGPTEDINTKLFSVFDVDKSGKLERKEAITFFKFLHQMLKNKGQVVPDDKFTWALQCLYYFDKEGNGVIGQLEFDEALMMADKNKGSTLRQNVIKAVSGNMIFNGQLQHAAKAYLDQLKVVTQDRNWQDPSFIETAIIRYFQWLSLRRKLNSPIPIPSDVEFILMVHMLHPVDYGRVMKGMLEKVHDKAMLVTSQVDKNTRESWNKEFGNKEPLTNKTSADYKHLVTPVIMTDLVKSSIGQIQFLGKLLALANNNESIIQSNRFLNRAVVDYRKFLYLKKVQPTQLLVPSMFVDLMWHAHMLNPIQYINDSMMIAGVVLDHDDSLGDDTLQDHWKTTNNAWRSQFGENLVSNSVTHYLTSYTTYGCGKKENEKKKSDNSESASANTGMPIFNFDNIASNCIFGACNTTVDNPGSCGAGACGVGGCSGGGCGGGCGGD